MKFITHGDNNISERRFGSLVAISFVGKSGPHYSWRCQCDCGAVFNALATALKSGRTQRCLRCSYILRGKKHAVHGQAKKTKEYTAWAAIKARCRITNKRHFDRYAGRGISVCPEWRNDFAAFFSHIGKSPTPKHSVERIDNDGNYEPGNVRWATAKEQANNKSSNNRITAFGRTQTVAEWASENGINPKKIYGRVASCKWPMEEIVTRK